MKTLDEKINLAVDKKISSIKYNFYIEQQQNAKKEKLHIYLTYMQDLQSLDVAGDSNKKTALHKKYMDDLNAVKIKHLQLKSWAQIKSEPVTDEFKEQIKLQVIEELNAKNPPAQQTAGIDPNFDLSQFPNVIKSD